MPATGNFIFAQLLYHIPPNELMNTVVQFMNLSSSNEINMFSAKDFASRSPVNICVLLGSEDRGASVVGSERSLLPSSDAESEGQTEAVKAK